MMYFSVNKHGKQVNFHLVTHDLQQNKICAATWENVTSDMCAQRRLRSACAAAQSDQSLRCPLKETLHPGTIQNAPREDSDQIALNLRWAHHISEGMFSNVSAHFVNFRT